MAANQHELEAEREMIDAERDELVVAREVAFRSQLDADEQAHLLLDRLDVRFDELEAVHALVAAVQVDERGTGLVLHKLQEIIHLLWLHRSTTWLSERGSGGRFCRLVRNRGGPYRCSPLQRG